MNKKKLRLNRNTVRKLNNSDLHEVAGAGKNGNKKRCNMSYSCTIIPMIPDNTFPDAPPKL